MDKGDMDKAFVDAESAIRLDVAFADAYVIRGSIYQAKGDLAKALADCETAARLDRAMTGRCLRGC